MHSKDLWKKVCNTFRFWLFQTSCISLWTQRKYACKAIDSKSSEKTILYIGKTAATYKLEESYATVIGELYAAATSILHTKVTSVHYQTLSKKHATWKINVNNLSVCSLQGLLLLIFDKRNNFLERKWRILQLSK